ncbi:hypothetical protein [Actinocorallia longicatena]|uniref:Secreted protein n=1 Tax=Actinocorallia longicatena TaxID=111803 RepID=A0ABP6QEX3_9ACTN
MDTGTVITLTIGVATLLGTVMAAVGGMAVEWWRSRHRERREQLAREWEQRALDIRELRSALAEVRSSVLTFSVDVQLTLEMLRSASARLDNGDLAQQIHRTRGDYPAAVTALEALWTLCPTEESRTAVEELCETAAWAFRNTWSAGGQGIAPEKVDEQVRVRLRTLSVSLAISERSLTAHPE